MDILAATIEPAHPTHSKTVLYLVYTYKLTRGKTGALFWRRKYFGFHDRIHQYFLRYDDALAELESRAIILLRRPSRFKGAFYRFKDEDLN